MEISSLLVKIMTNSVISPLWFFRSYKAISHMKIAPIGVILLHEMYGLLLLMDVW